MTLKQKYYQEAMDYYRQGLKSDAIAAQLADEDTNVISLGRAIRTWISELNTGVNQEKPKKKKIPFSFKVDLESNMVGATVLAIGDLHSPFILDGYFEFCKETYKKYKCDTVVFIGDVIDSHFSSFHATDPDGLGGGDELQLAIEMLKPWHDEFPNAIVVIGNHDKIIRRKAFDSGIPKAWIKSFADALQVPSWNFLPRYIIDDVLYTHGMSGNAAKKAKDSLRSVVQGHRHTELGVTYLVGDKFRIFGAQTGCGIDRDSYALAYARDHKKQAIGCVVVEEGIQAIAVPMQLENK